MGRISRISRSSRASKTVLNPLRPKTLEIHGGETLYDKEIRPGLHRVVTFPLQSPERAKRIFEGSERGFVYTRINNPTVDKFEKRIAAMEGAEAGLATASGMAAIDLVAKYLAHSGGHIVASNQLYGGVFYLFRELLPTLGISVTFVDDPHDPKAWERAIVPGTTKFLYVENLSNPLIGVFNITCLADIAHRHGIPLVVDSTLATPVLLRPLTLGADIVIHSASKYMGNGEVIAGVILGKQELIDDLRNGWFRDTGACLSPDNAAILCSHLESLSARVLEQSRSAAKLASFLSAHPSVQEVFYPTDHPLMPKGSGGLLAFAVRGGWREAYTVISHLQIPWLAANIGEARSLVIHPATTTHEKMTDEERRAAGILESTIRYSVGLEDSQDLIDDLERALAEI
ncbi:MAG: aminotransferase class I/II-fold pyridoxal phosphate-dependent enzyme [bacterium]|nr:aminotransferase class I/II-fold pyridoxal phosphate-dependent enzyme [bacterium]